MLVKFLYFVLFVLIFFTVSFVVGLTTTPGNFAFSLLTPDIKILIPIVAAVAVYLGIYKLERSRP